MATLEVHNGRGRVERVNLANDQPLMFGSSPKCDLVLSGEGVLPFHGRLRWQEKKGRFKVDASPEAEYLLVNGHKMASSSFRQGDEVLVGPNRIFLISDGMPAPPPAAPARDDKTRVQPAPFLAPPTAGSTIKRGSWRQNQEVEPPSIEVAVDEEQQLHGREARSKPEPNPWEAAAARSLKQSQKPAQAPVEPLAEPPPGWKRFFHVFTARAYAPGQERVLSSPLVFTLGLALAVLIVVGVALYGIIAKTAADRLFDQAVGNLNDGDYRTAIKGFDKFLKDYPGDSRAGKVRVHRAMANIRQYTTAAGASWSLALEAEQAMLESVSEEESYHDAIVELSELVLKTGEELADRARGSADAKLLALAESAVALHAKVAGKAAEAALKKSRLPDKIAVARAAVNKEKTRRDRLAAMDAALAAGSSSGVYAARDALVAEYADQADDRELLARMTEANALIRKAVSVDPSGRPGETEPHPDPLGPATTLVLRNAGAKPSATEGPLVFALADGMAYAIDGSTGAPVWQVAVGESSPFPPQVIPGASALLVFDSRHQELVRLDLRTGGLVWRQALDGPILDPPLILGNQVIETTPAGKLLIIDLPTGALRATVDLGLPLARGAVCDESGQVLYVVANHDCLFVLNRDPMGCERVEYLGHAAGSVLGAPLRIGRYLVVAENHRINEGRWRVFLLDESGTRPSAVQQVPAVGWTWGVPATSGSVIWSATDQGGIAAYALGAYGEKEPFRLIARINAEQKPLGPAFALARTERELLVGSGRSGRYVLDPEQAKLSASWTLAEAGPALGPPQLAGGLLVLTQQHNDGAGVGLWGVEPKSGEVRWRTVLGAPWPIPPAVGREPDVLTALGGDGRALAVSAASLAQGGFIESPLPRAGSFRLPPGPLAKIDGEGWTVVVPQAGSDTLLVKGGAGGEFKEVGLPSATGARPLAWGSDLLVPGNDGHVYLIDPLTGGSSAQPFVPPFDRNRPTRWLPPSALGSEAVAIADEGGVVRRLVREREPRPRLVVAAETSLGSAIVAPPVSTTGAIVVATVDGKVRSLASRDLSPIDSWPLDAALAADPATVEGRGYVTDAHGGVLALGDDGRRLWSARLGEGTMVVGSPAVRGGEVWFLSRDGRLSARVLDDGSKGASHALGILPAGGPVAVGKELAVPVGVGSLRLLKGDAK